MDEKEKYGIELVAETSYFKRGLKELLNYTKAFGQGMKESFVEQSKEIADGFKNQFAQLNINKVIEKNGKTFKIEIDPELDIDKLREASENYEKLIKKLKQRKSTATTEKESNTYDKDIEMYEVKLQAIKDRIKEIVNGEERVNEELKKTSRTTKNINLEGLFDRSIGKIKRFTYYLLGARSVFSLFMKYQSIYYQYNEKMQYQSELSQNAIALSLAPAFEFLGNVMTYASISFAKFIELLTGVNVLSKVSTKGIRDYNKSLKETQTLVSGIDEITNLTNPQNLGLAGQYKALADFQKKVAEVEKFFTENTWINDLAETLKDDLKTVWDYLQNRIWPIIADTLWPFIKKYIFPLVKDIVDLIESMVGLIDDIFEKLGVFNYVVKPIMAFAKSIVHIAEFIVEAIDAIFHLDVEGFARASKKLVNNIQSDWEDLFKTKYVVNADFKVEDKSDFEDTYKKLKEIKNGDYGSIIIDFGSERKFKEFQQWLKDTKKDADLLGEGLDYSTIIDDNANKFKYFQKQINNWKIDKKIIELGLKYNIPKSQVQSLINKVRGISVSLMGMSENTFNNIASRVLKNFGYAKGLDYVPYDNYPALLHKGEAVVPAKYNPTIHSEGNEYTNSLLETLISKVDDLRNRPNEFNIDGKRLARATYPLLRAEAKNYTYNEGVSR